MKDLVSNFDPDKDAFDKRILYEITGRKYENEVYSDEEGDVSDGENSENPHSINRGQDDPE